MLSENLKELRKQKGLSQEELAARLAVVRQTVSKWEKGTSVPDSEMLIKLADIFEVSVSDLLGETIETAASKSELQLIADKLEQTNALLAERNARSRTVTRIIAFCLIAAVAVYALSLLAPVLILSVLESQSVGIIGGADGPTSVFVAGDLGMGTLIGALFAAAALVTAIVLLRRHK